MSARRPARERRELPSLVEPVMVPFRFFDDAKIRQLDLLEDMRVVQEAALGREETRERRPYDPFTSWVAFAYMGCIEEDGPWLDPKLNREQRLDVARTVLTEDEVVVVETIAVPKRYREMSAQALVELIRAAPDYIDRMWAGCWLELIGWTRSPECPFRKQWELPDEFDQLSETIVETYARSIGVTRQDDELGWIRIYTDYEAGMVGHRLAICQAHYDLNGPPPYEYTKQTVAFGPGWKQMVRLVPEHPRNR